jgi:hypothetical protein
MSFHSYVRKLQDRQRSSGLPLERNLLNDFVDELVKKTRKKGGLKFNIKDLAQPIFLERQVFLSLSLSLFFSFFPIRFLISFFLLLVSPFSAVSFGGSH